MRYRYYVRVRSTWAGAPWRLVAGPYSSAREAQNHANDLKSDSEMASVVTRSQLVREGYIHDWHIAAEMDGDEEAMSAAQL